MSDEGLTMDMMSTRTFEFYQLKRSTAETAVLKYMSYDWVKAHGYVVDQKNYEMVYSGELTPGTTHEDLYRRFNTDKPVDFTGRSMSVSDVVVFCEDGRRTAYYCDRMGFREIEEWR